MSNRKMTDAENRTEKVNMTALVTQVLDLSAAHLQDPRNWCRGSDHRRSEDPDNPDQRCGRGTIYYFAGQVAVQGVSGPDLGRAALAACHSFLLRRMLIFGLTQVNDHFGRRAAIWAIKGGRAYA